MATTSSAVRQLSDGNSVGTVLGQSSTDVIGFYGVTTGAGKYSFSSAVQQSVSSGALTSCLAIALNRLGLINASTLAP